MASVLHTGGIQGVYRGHTGGKAPAGEGKATLKPPTGPGKAHFPCRRILPVSARDGSVGVHPAPGAAITEFAGTRDFISAGSLSNNAVPGDGHTPLPVLASGPTSFRSRKGRCESAPLRPCPRCGSRRPLQPTSSLPTGFVGQKSFEILVAEFARAGRASDARLPIHRWPGAN